MVNIYKRLALDQPMVYSPQSVIQIFQEFVKQGFLDFDSIPSSYQLVSSRNLVDEWRNKGCQDILAICYMCANNILPILTYVDRRADHTDLVNLITQFILDPFIALKDYYEKPGNFFRKLQAVRTKIAKDFYWSEQLEYLEDQILFVLAEFGYRKED